jgi:hypothetical protein
MFQTLIPTCQSAYGMRIFTCIGYLYYVASQRAIPKSLEIAQECVVSYRYVRDVAIIGNHSIVCASEVNAIIETASHAKATEVNQ